MIRINLLQEKEDHTLQYLAQSFVFLASVMGVLFGCFTFHGTQAERLDTLKTQKTQLKVQLAKLEKQTKESDKLQEKQKVLQEKLKTIAVLKSKKRGPVHVLYDINKSIPERAWLQSIAQTDASTLLIDGVAIDDQTVSDFMQGLEGSNYLNKVELIHTTQIERDQVKLKEFGLSVSVSTFVMPGMEKFKAEEEGKEKKDV